MAFPPDPPPPGYATVYWPNKWGIFYAGGPDPTGTLNASYAAGPTSATAYTVRDYYGTVVSTGPVSGASVALAAPAGGWLPGWYRLYLTGPNSNAEFSNSSGASNFVILRNDPRFPAPPTGTFTEYGGEMADPVGKALFGMGTSRIILGDVTKPEGPGVGIDKMTLCLVQAAVSDSWWQSPSHAAYADSARPRHLWAATPWNLADHILLPAASGTLLTAYVKDDSVSGDTTFVSLGPGSTSGFKVTVFSPTSTDVVETWDNLASTTAAEAAINTASSFIRVFGQGGSGVGTMPAKAIGSAYRQGVISWVQGLYPTVTRFEFTNEPQAVPGRELVQRERAFVEAVHAANPAAKAIGPCFVGIDGDEDYVGSDLGKWKVYLDAGGCQFFDEISTHDYGTLNAGDIPRAREVIDKWLAMLADHGLDAKTRWQTESALQFACVFGIHHPRRARHNILHTLLWEQYDVPRERNPLWYDRSHGFWGFPSWWQAGDGSVTPDAPLHRTLAEETFGMTHVGALDFGQWAGGFALGSLYGSAAGRVVVVQASSYLPDGTVTLRVTGATGTVVVVDGFGRESSATISKGLVTVPLGEIPTYVRLPAAATAAVHTVNGWPPIGVAGQGYSTAGLATAVTPVAGRRPTVTDGDLATGYDGVNAEIAPTNMTMQWPEAVRADRVLIFTGNPYQNASALVDFDVQTSLDGSTWTTRATVTKPTPSTFIHGTRGSNMWCKYETYWDEQSVFDVPFAAPVVFTHLRVVVRATSYGGEPDAQSVAYGGQGNSEQRICIRDIVVLCDDNTRPQILRHTP